MSDLNRRHRCPPVSLAGTVAVFDIKKAPENNSPGALRKVIMRLGSLEKV